MDKPKNKKLLIIGGYGFGNVGDEAILSGLLKENRHLYNEITVFSRNPSETMSLHNVNAEKKNVLRILSCDDIIVGGGELFQDRMARKNAAAIILAKIMRKSVKVLGVGIDIDNKIDKFLTSISLKIVDEISVRDNRSANNLISMGINPKKIKIVKDYAFLLEPKPTEEINKLFIDQLNGFKFIVFILRQKNVDIDNELLSFFTIFINDLLQKRQDFKILLIPFSRHPDNSFGNDIFSMEKLKNNINNNRVIMFNGTFDPSSILWLISKANVVISTRLHPLIFSKIVKTRGIAIPLFLKIRSFAEEYDYQIVEIKDLPILYNII